MNRITGMQGNDEWGRDLNKPQIKLPNMILIPGGSFLMGTSEEDIKQLQLKESDWAYEWNDNNLFAAEQPQHIVTLEPFEIEQYSVTNADYHVFIWDTGYQLPKSWDGFKYREDMATHPVVGVSKKDAEAYIAWLNEKTSKNFRLPNEAEWERTARGTDGRIYPWGNTFDPWRCNTAESVKKSTTPVGFYSPGGDSPCGAADMIGNVWEWTSSLFLPYPYQADQTGYEHKNNSRYVIRGGAWYYTRKLARCSTREGMHADRVSNSVGFRLARTPIE